MKKLAAAIFFDSFLLILLGLVIVLSASSTYSAVRFESSFALFNSHVLKVLLGMAFLALFSFIPYTLYKEYSKPAIFVITLVLIITLIIAPDIKGAGRWLNLGIFSFQPADAAKLILVMHLSSMIIDKKEIIGNFKHGFLFLFFWVAVIGGLILLQPNISNGLLIVFVSITLLYVGGAKIRHILSISTLCLLIAGSAAMLFSHSRGRILSFINSVQTGGDINLQVKQALLGLGSGGIFGVGMGHSKQSNLFLPEAYGDFIFAILGEELGLVGAVAVLLLYLLFFIAGILIAKKTKDPYGQLLAFGITFTIIIYAFINVAVAIGLVPTTGLPLPFISYGGTSLIFMCISVGILINIAITPEMHENKIEREKIEFTGK